MSHTHHIDDPHERRPLHAHGHDARTAGDGPCVLVDTGVAAYARPS